MTIITTRTEKGSPLSWNEMDNNLISLNTYKVEKTSDTGAAIIPSGTTAQQPVGGTGMIRINSDISNLEFWNGSYWALAGTGVGGSPTRWQTVTFEGDGITQAFPLPFDPETNSECDISVSGVTQVADVDFNIYGTTLGFIVAPPDGTTIAVRYGTATVPSAAAWGSITGTLSNQTDLQSALNTKITSVSVASANGFTGTSSGGTTPSLTLKTSITGILKGNGTAISAATSGTDYAPATSGTSILYGDGAGGFSNVTIGSNLTFVGGTLSATGGGGSATWGGITGTLSDQTDLNTALSAKQATITATGLLKGAGSGNVSAAVSGTDYVTPSGNEALTNKTINGLTLSGTNGTVMTFPAENASVGFRNVPQNSRSAAYTCVLEDSGKHIFHPAADTTARTWTIPSNASVAYPVGTSIMFVNEGSAGVITIAIASDTMVLAGAGTTGNRTLAANGVATATKITSTKWIIYGTGLT